MSYIHEALQKAQKEKDARFPAYKKILAGSKKKSSIFFLKMILLIFLFVIFVAFTVNSWFDFNAKKTISAPKKKKVVVPLKKEASLNGVSFYQKAKYLQKIGRLKEAQRLYEQALTLEPENTSVLNNLGVIYIQQQDYSKARNILESAIRLKPEYVDPYYNLACLYAYKGQGVQSLKNLRMAISIDKSVIEWARKDRDLQNLRGMPEFEEITGKR